MFKKVLFILISLTILNQNLMANEQKNLKEHFLKKIAEVIVIVKNKENNKSMRNSKIVATLTPMFDFELMAKLSLGKTWKTLTAIEKKKFVSLYVERMKKSYSSKIDSYSDEKVEISSLIQPKNNRIKLITNLVSQNEKLEVVYKFYKPKKQKTNKDRWLVYDVIILGVSIIKTDKAQFKEFLQTNNISELMKQISVN